MTERGTSSRPASASSPPPFCEQCGSTEDLQLDHQPSAWLRKAAGKPIRPQDVRVLCRLCNVAAGKARPETQGTGTVEQAPGLRGKPHSPLQTSIDDGEPS